ncbi:conserved hypothetical protein [Burkholderia pseudomallei 1106b]|uniref:Uncharacterized protein n=1 Tax=Burkholderia pseudomallei (strain 1106a) TaxID=357348 RepID=A3NT33_BURP0|nr:conserved hypothetical protein [Burkholderia pseudomallei 1106a]AFR15158.1 hypothetical protein BPC006_I1273 [Burkholderia pseudomallei BPC006]EES26318.1 conserved hypothetical protein [Burkholderia pseudomallei 1106b]
MSRPPSLGPIVRRPGRDARRARRARAALRRLNLRWMRRRAPYRSCRTAPSARAARRLSRRPSSSNRSSNRSASSTKPPPSPIRPSSPQRRPLAICFEKIRVA